MGALVTGASGCLGRALVDDLHAEGWQVRTTARMPADLPDFHAADLVCDDLAPLVRGMGAVFHCAALSSAWGSRAAFEAANVTATGRLLDAATDARVPRFVFASTPSLYADGTDRLDVSEDAPLPRRAMTAYADTKRRAEALVLEADGAMACTAIRPRAIYGCHDRSLLPRLVATLRRGRAPMIGGGAALIDLTHCKDAARGMRLAAAGPGGRVWNVTSGEAFTFRDLVERAARHAGLAYRPMPLPYAAALGLASVSEALARLLGDGRLVAIPLPGDGIGQLGLWIPEIARFLVADAVYARSALRENRMPPGAILARLGDADAYRRTFADLRALMRARPDIAFDPSHCRETAGMEARP